MKRKKGFVKIGTILAVIISLWFLQRLLMPKYMGTVVEGALIAEYYLSLIHI